MINQSDIKVIFFIGIGGIGMSALARYFNSRGVQIFGYDKTETALTRQLIKEGMHIHYQDDIALIPANIDLVVYTPAIPASHRQLRYFLENRYPVKKRSEILEMITQNRFTVAISGSHGKTTVTSMIAHLLVQARKKCIAFLGGIAVNYNSNYLDTAVGVPYTVGGVTTQPCSDTDAIVVVEADEYDRSFHRLVPDIAVITAIDTDHLDVYGSRQNIEEAFLIFTRKLKPEGITLVHEAVSILQQIGGNVITYGHQDADVCIQNTRHEKGQTIFDVRIRRPIAATGHDRFSSWPSEEITFRNCSLNMPGEHNAENAAAAIAVALLLDVDRPLIESALASFAGVKRRFEYIIRKDDLIFIDDYAHHPEEIRRFLEAVKTVHPGKRITVIFQPHLYSRTRDLQHEFAQALSMADSVILLPIYPAREEPIEGVSAQLILDKISSQHKLLLNKDELISYLSNSKTPEVICTVGAGDIDMMIDPIRQQLESRR